MNFHHNKHPLALPVALFGAVAMPAAASTLTLSANTNLTSDIAFKEDSVLDGAGFEMVREGKPCIVVDGATLTVKDITISGGTGRAFYVRNGGTLVFESGTLLTGVSCSDGNSPVDVKGANFVLESGASITDCVNTFVRANGGPLVAGAVVASSTSNEFVVAISEVRLNGGTVSGCSSSFAGGVCIGLFGKVFVQGDAIVDGNTLLDGSTRCNLLVHNMNGLVLDGEFSGTIGYTEGTLESTNVFGSVSGSFSGDATASAARFYRDSNRATGLVEGSSLYWADAIPPVYETVYPDPISFKSIVETESGWELVVTNVVECCNYRLLYTDDIEDEFTVLPGFDWTPAGQDGEWVIEVGDGPSGARFWKAEGKEGEKLVE